MTWVIHCYAVLAYLSVCYPCVQGRLPTRYSPVRRSSPKRIARLACVRHAASVHPEPGSNSQIKCSRCQIKVQNHWFFSCHYCLFRFWTFVLFHGLSCRHHSQENPNEIWINVQGCFVIQLSRFLAFSYESFYILSHHFILVKNFFKKLFSSSFEDFCFSWCELLYVITWFSICQEVFSFSFKILVIFLLKMSFSCATHIILS